MTKKGQAVGLVISAALTSVPVQRKPVPLATSNKTSTGRAKASPAKDRGELHLLAEMQAIAAGMIKEAEDAVEEAAMAEEEDTAEDDMMMDVEDALEEASSFQEFVDRFKYYESYLPPGLYIVGRGEN